MIVMQMKHNFFYFGMSLPLILSLIGDTHKQEKRANNTENCLLTSQTPPVDKRTPQN
jgi:hypothetical protein